MTQPVFPIALLLEGRTVLVVGSSAEATSRTKALLDAHAKPVVVSLTPSAELLAWASAGQIRLHLREFEPTDLDDAWLSVLVDENAELAARMSELADAKRVFFCAVDQPEHNSYAHMAQARAGLLTIAISTAGQAPALGRRLREELERLMADSDLADFVEQLAGLRAQTPSALRRQVLGEAVRGVRFDGVLRLRE
jgi:siroheme synthase-like protein